MARRSEADPNFALYQRLDPDAAALMGFSVGGALAIYAAEESQRAWPAGPRSLPAHLNLSPYAVCLFIST